MLRSYFDNIFVHLRQKVRLRPELSPKFLSTLGPNPARTRTRPEKPGPTYNSDSVILKRCVATPWCIFHIFQGRHETILFM